MEGGPATLEHEILLLPEIGPTAARFPARIQPHSVQPSVFRQFDHKGSTRNNLYIFSGYALG
jgi:hypothetical protein